MSEREKIFNRITEALRVKAPASHGHHADATGPLTSSQPSQHQARAWLPVVGTSPEERLTQFQRAASDLKAEVVLLKDLAHLSDALRAMATAEGWKKIGIHHGELTDQASRSLSLPECRTDAAYDVGALESCDAGITECDALIAQTGSVLVTTRSAGGRALSVLPPHHVVLARREQLLPDLPAAFELLKTKYAANYPSFISLITGPSRTGDIERILVLGAHGPKRLTIFVI
jgi:L-lactate dehydrogenase complex protein LldG